MRNWRFVQLVQPSARTSDEDLEVLTNAIADERDRSNGIPAAYTYLGQFIAHDLTELRRGSRDPERGPVDVRKLKQARKPVLDLDSLYGAGPDDSVVPYKRKSGKLILGKTTVSKKRDKTGTKRYRDLPRKSDGTPLIADARNDENLLVAQMHVLFMRFHNKLIDHYKQELGDKVGADRLFELARREAVLTYQWIVLHDFARRILPDKIYEHIVRKRRGNVLDRNYESPVMSVEFAGAAFRMGHSMVRNTYEFSKVAPAVNFAELFSYTGKGVLSQDVLLPEKMIVNWRKFLETEGGGPSGSISAQPDNQARRIDTGIAVSMQHIPHHCGSGNIVDLNIRRGRELGLATGQQVCAYLLRKHQDVSRDVDLSIMTRSDLLDGFEEGSPLKTQTPLWAYVLSEAQQYVDTHGPKHLATLGTMGGWIVADGLRAASETADVSLFNIEWFPRTSVIGRNPVTPRANQDELSLKDLVSFTYPNG